MTHFMTVALPGVADGMKLEVEYETEGDGSGPSYSPMYGADGGDPLIIHVVDVSYEDFSVAHMCLLTASEEEAVAAYICEHHEFDYDVEYDYRDES